jgi:hypothetical protein
MYAGAELAAQIGRVREALRPLMSAVGKLGSDEAAYAKVDAYDREALLDMACQLEEAAQMLRGKASEGPKDED